MYSEVTRGVLSEPHVATWPQQQLALLDRPIQSRKYHVSRGQTMFVVDRPCLLWTNHASRGKTESVSDKHSQSWKNPVSLGKTKSVSERPSQSWKDQVSLGKTQSVLDRPSQFSLNMPSQSYTDLVSLGQIVSVLDSLTGTGDLGQADGLGLATAGGLHSLAVWPRKSFRPLVRGFSEPDLPLACARQILGLSLNCHRLDPDLPTV